MQTAMDLFHSHIPHAYGYYVMADISSEEYTRPQLMVSELRPSIITWSTDIPQCLMQSIAMPQLAVFFDSFELIPYTLIPYTTTHVYTRAVFWSGPVHLSVVWKVAYVNENLIIFT